MDDKTKWKQSCPTFESIIERIQKYFKMDIKATRFNWYKDTSQWKRKYIITYLNLIFVMYVAFHHDAAYVNPLKALEQNFTVAVSFGATRDAAFEHATTKTVISLPQPDGCVYAFANHTNGIWRHGILQDTPVRDEGRISIIAWGWIDGITQCPT